MGLSVAEGMLAYVQTTSGACRFVARGDASLIEPAMQRAAEAVSALPHPDSLGGSLASFVSEVTTSANEVSFWIDASDLLEEDEAAVLVLSAVVRELHALECDVELVLPAPTAPPEVARDTLSDTDKRVLLNWWVRVELPRALDESGIVPTHGLASLPSFIDSFDRIETLSALGGVLIQMAEASAAWDESAVEAIRTIYARAFAVAVADGFGERASDAGDLLAFRAVDPLRQGAERVLPDAPADAAWEAIVSCVADNQGTTAEAVQEAAASDPDFASAIALDGAAAIATQIHRLAAQTCILAERAAAADSGDDPRDAEVEWAHEWRDAVLANVSLPPALRDRVFELLLSNT